jgi:hypothetical protein
MVVSVEELERGLDLLLEVARARPGLGEEFHASRADYFGGDPPNPEAPDSQHALRRHAEWFLLERSSECLAGVPVECLSEAWDEHADAPLQASYEAMLRSRAGIFVVTGVTPGQGVWVRDLTAFGEHPLHEPDGSRALRPGDLLVGRIFPVGESLYRISGSAAFFRNSELLRALEDDLQHLRASRRGVLRIAQVDLERMFFADRALVAGSSALQETRNLLLEAGLTPDEVEQVLDQLAAHPMEADALQLSPGGILMTILDRLAFETDIDLDAARRALLAAWSVLSNGARSAREQSDPIGDPTEDDSAAAERRSVAAAVAAFDRGRAEGRNLAQLFDQLEAELDLQDEGGDPQRDTAPDFPGVVAAVVEEFLWDVEREKGQTLTRDYSVLRRFGAFAEDVGVFENLGAQHLLCFAAIWLPEQGGLGNADQARRAVLALRAFCRWAQERQHVPLLDAFRATLSGIGDSLPRIVEANRRRASASDGATGELFQFDGLDAQSRPTLVDRSGERHTAPLDSGLTRWLRPGDRLRAEPQEDGSWLVYCCYPPESSHIFDASARESSDHSPLGPAGI